MKQSRHLAAGLVLTIAALTGCSPASTLDPKASATTDQAQVASELSATTDLIDDGQLDDSSVGVMSSSQAPRGALELVRPYRYWRNITHVDRSFEFAFTDTDSTGRPRRAVVTIHKTLTGTFNVVTGAVSDTAGPDSGIVVHKPLLDHWTRQLLVERVRPDGERGEGGDSTVKWRVAGTTGVHVVSDLPAEDHVQITSVHIVNGALDTTITDPVQFFRLRQILRLTPGDSISITVATTHADDIVLVVHNGHRFRLRPNGDGTYSGNGWVPYGIGVRHFGVNALARGTLFDDAAPYDSDGWIFPFVKRDEVLADYR